MNERTCRRCGAPTWSSRSPYCREHRPPPEERAKWATKTREARGYGAAHRTLRANVARLVEAGQAVCARCGRPIVPGTAWDLGHTEDRSAYSGPEHRRCNQLAGAKRGAAITNSRRLPGEPEKRLNWSRVWFEPIPDYVYVAPEVLEEYRREKLRQE